MKKYTNILLLVGSILVFSCEDDKGSENNYSVNADYVGIWKQTYFAQFDGDACSGTPEFEDTTLTTTYTLNNDGTVLTSGTFFCNEVNNTTEEICQDKWGASGNTIRIGAAPFGTEYTVTDTDEGLKMTSEFDMMGSNSPDEEMTPICQKYVFTKQ